MRGPGAVRSRAKKDSAAGPPGGNGRAPDGPLSQYRAGAEDDPAGAPRGERVDQASVSPRRGFRRGLKNWRVRSRLVLLIIIPTLTAIVLGGARIESSVRSALIYQRVEQLAKLTTTVTNLDLRLEDERDQTVYYIALPNGRDAALSATASSADRKAAQAQLTRVVEPQQKATNAVVAQVRAMLRQIGSSYSPLTRRAAATALTELDSLKYLRHAATQTQLPALVVVQKYAQLIDSLSPSQMTLALEGETGRGSSDATLSQAVNMLGLVSRMKEEASKQRAILTAGLLQGNLTPAQLQALTTAQANQLSNLRTFDLSATPSQLQFWNNSVSRSHVDLANQEELQAIALSTSTGSLKADPTTADDWYGAMSNEIDSQMGSVEHNLGTAVTSRAASLRNAAVTSAVTVGVVVLLVLALALGFTVMVARSMVRPLRRLRAGALEVAGVRLPETVRRMAETDGAAGEPLDIAPIDVNSSDEIGEVARAFDQVHREALRLASNEAALRSNVNAMFMNLSRRSQSLVERQIRLIDDLEQGEQDAERLGNLFQLDHLATRMRRNSENLLVLAGHDVTRRWTQAVALVDVLRAAVSEIEQYERVTLSVQPGIAVRGQAVSDVVHLVAELAENATTFSAASTPVNVSGHVLGSGGVLLDITDQGVGIGAEEMAHANWRLDNPPVVDVAVSRRMGLFVVARLAARHGIRVRLRQASMGGLTALVWLPDEVISRESPLTPAEARGLDASLSAVGGAGGSGRAQDWLVGNGTDSDRAAAAARAVTAARMPRFTPLRADVGDTAAFPAIGGDGDPAGEDGLAASHDDGGGPPAGSGPLPLVRSTGPMPVLGAPVASGDVQSFPRLADEEVKISFGGELGQTQREVIVPPAANAGEHNRLPIFDSVESDWFRRGRHSTDPGGPGESTAASGWASPADRGWEAAEAAHAPASAGVTRSGLPKRVPRANLVPGSAGQTGTAPAPARSAVRARERLASFQRGVREGRAAARESPGSGDEDDRAP